MLPEPIKSALIEMIQLWCVDACLAAYDEFDMAEAEIRNLGVWL